MEPKKDGLLIPDRDGFFHLYEASTLGCWHYDTACDGTCATAGSRVTGFTATNAYGPAEVQAAKLGYTIALHGR